MVLPQKNAHEEKWNRTEDSGMNPCSHTHLIFDKGAQNICCWENWIFACRKLKLDPHLSPCTSINSKWIKDFNKRPETLKQVQERTGNTLELIGIGKDFLNRIQMAQQQEKRLTKGTP
jgi:hypothetical protein